MGSLQDFMKVSELLTGIDHLDPGVGDDYRRRLETTSGVALDELVDGYRAVASAPAPLGALTAQFGSDPKGQRMRRSAQQVVRIWYLSEYVDATGTLSGAGHFPDSILYDVIEAHAPSFSDKPHGYWVKKPVGGAQ